MFAIGIIDGVLCSCISVKMSSVHMNFPLVVISVTDLCLRSLIRFIYAVACIELLVNAAKRMSELEIPGLRCMVVGVMWLESEYSSDMS